MKKNRMMRVASTLLVAVLLSTCAVSGTFAKYVTSASGSDTARVAKWGVEVGGMDNKLFKTTYDDTVATSVAGTHVVAPGTKNDTGVTFSLTGIPEVAVDVKVKVTGADGEDIKDVCLKGNKSYKDYTKDKDSNDTFEVEDDYYPVVFTLKDGDKTLEEGNLSEIKTYLEGENMSKRYEANTDLSKIHGDSTTGVYTLTWEWKFDGNEQADTLLGNVAAGEVIDGANVKIDFKIDITVTQID